MRVNSHILVLTAIGIVLANLPTETLRSQSPASTPLSFEVASIKLNRNPPAGPQVVSLKAGLSHGRLTFQAVTLRNLIQQAYDIQRDRIEGCPRWGDEDRFDIVARAEDPDATQEQVTLMLRTLLADRFKLALHREEKNVAGYALVLNKAGSKLQLAKDDEALSFTTKGFVRIFQKFPIAGLVNFLANAARQPVVDMTGLKGTYDFTIDVTTTEMSEKSAAVGTPTAADPNEAFTRLLAAVEAQLGLKLEARKVVVENLVIDTVDHPSEN